MRFLSILLGLTYSVVCLAQIDTRLLESVLNNTFVEVVGYHEFLELSEDETVLSKIEIDHDYSNFDLGRIKASLITQTVPLASNLDEKIRLSADISTNITDTDDERKSFDLSANVNIQGNTLAILKHISSILGECTQEPIDDETSNSVHIGNIMCHVQTGINDSSFVVELQGGLQEAANYAKLVYGAGAETDSIIGDLFSSLTIVPNGDDLVLTVTIDSDINLTEGEENTDKINAVIVLTIKEKGMELAVNGNAIFEDRQLDEYLELVKNTATELQDRDSETHVTYYEDNLYLIFGLLEAFLIPEDDDDDF